MCNQGMPAPCWESAINFRTYVLLKINKFVACILAKKTFQMVANECIAIFLHLQNFRNPVGMGISGTR